MKVFRTMIWVIMDTILFLTLLFSAVQAVVYFDPYFEWHYEQHHIESTTGMTVQELMVVTDKMMDYLIDKRDTLDMTATIHGREEEVFGDREKAHMKDVKTLFMGGKHIRDYGAIVLIIILLYMWRSRKEQLSQCIRQLKYFFLSAFGVSTILFLLFQSNFSKYFIMFHEIFFDNDLWLLDPRTDILINMVPEIFFFQTALLILMVFIIFVIATLVIMNQLGKRIIKR